MAALTADQVIEKYVELRDQIAEITKEAAARTKPLADKMEIAEKWLMGEIMRTGLKNLPTKHGTAYVLRQESVTCADWDAYLNWIKAGNRWEFLERRVNKTAALELMGETRTQSPPPGVNYSAFNKIGVRKS